ncbi:hypothetical protein LINPERHAP1_LOCUS19135 [Linum perenne]
MDDDLIAEIIGMLPLAVGQGEDEWIWGLENNGKFSICTTYNLVYINPNPRSEVDWQSVWKWKDQVWISLGFSSIVKLGKDIRLSNWIRIIISHDKALELGIACQYLWKSRNE